MNIIFGLELLIFNQFLFQEAFSKDLNKHNFIKMYLYKTYYFKYM